MLRLHTDRVALHGLSWQPAAASARRARLLLALLIAPLPILAADMTGWIGTYTSQANVSTGAEESIVLSGTAGLEASVMCTPLLRAPIHPF